MRANSIFRKLDEQAVSTGSGSDRVAPGPLAEAGNLIRDRKQDVANLLDGEVGNEIWSLLMLAARLEEANAQAAASAEPAFLAKYTFNLARAFNLFYHRHRIIAEEDKSEARRADCGGGLHAATIDRGAGEAGNLGAGADVGNDPIRYFGYAA